MKIITQVDLFEEENLGDLEKLSRIFQVLPDEPLLNALNQDRGKGHNDFPNHTMWRAFWPKLYSSIQPLKASAGNWGVTVSYGNSAVFKLTGLRLDGIKRSLFWLPMP